LGIDGDGWSVQTPAGSPTTLSQAYYDGVQWYSVGVASSTAFVQKSYDAINWTSITTGVSGMFVDLAYNPSNGVWAFVVFGSSSKIYTTTDFVTFTLRLTTTSKFMTSVSYGNNTFVAVGQSGNIYTSSDGTTWTKQTPANSFTGEFDWVEYVNGQFVAVGGPGAIQTSPNGIDWTAQTPANSSTSYFCGVAYGNNTLVIVGINSTDIQSSTDNGVTWTQRTSATGCTHGVIGIAFGSGTFIAVGAAGELQGSTDGITWTRQVQAGGYVSTWGGISYGNNMFIAMGGSQMQTKYMITMSSVIPAAATVASVVRNELATELGRIDVATSTRSTFAGGAVASVTAPVTVGSYSTGQSPAELVLYTPAQKLVTDASGNAYAVSSSGAALATAAGITAIEGSGFTTGDDLHSIKTALPGAGPSASTIAAAVVDQTLTGHQTTGTVGASLGYVASLTAEVIADAVVEELIPTDPADPPLVILPSRNPSKCNVHCTLRDCGGSPCSGVIAKFVARTPQSRVPTPTSGNLLVDVESTATSDGDGLLQKELTRNSKVAIQILGCVSITITVPDAGDYDIGALEMG
jgi:hypothetical protein